MGELCGLVQYRPALSYLEISILYFEKKGIKSVKYRPTLS